MWPALPNNEWMCKVAECFPSMVKQLGLDPPKILVRDNDTKFTREFDHILRLEGICPYRLPVQSPLMNAHIERWIKSLKVECLNHFIPVGTKHLDHLIGEFRTLSLRTTASKYREQTDHAHRPTIIRGRDQMQHSTRRTAQALSPSRLIYRHANEAMMRLRSRVILVRPI